MTVSEFLDRMGRRSECTRAAYGSGLSSFAKYLEVESADDLVSKFKSDPSEVYRALDKFACWLGGNGAAPKTIWSYVGAVKSWLENEDISLDKSKLRRIQLPARVEISVDRIPTRQELRNLIINAPPLTRALIALLASSGLRIGEAANLRVGNLELAANRVTVTAAKTKSRRTRTTFISDEASAFIREYLGTRINRKDEWLFPDQENPLKPCSRIALYMRIFRVLEKQGVRTKLDPDSSMYELHPHSFRKYFFTKLIAAGVDRGIAEHLMGHKFGLDNAYLRMDEDRLRKEYMKAADEFTFLHDRKLDRESQERVDQLQELLKRKDEELAATNQRLAKLEATNPDTIREEVRRVLQEQGPELLKELQGAK